jgi:hypothetical protein
MEAKRIDERGKEVECCPNRNTLLVRKRHNLLLAGALLEGAQKGPREVKTPSQDSTLLIARQP